LRGLKNNLKKQIKMNIICYIIGLVISMLSIKEIFNNFQFLYLITLIIGILMAIYGKVNLYKK
jgi:hypothetical protein